MKPREILEAFDAFLLTRGLSLEAVVVGGAALNLLGVITRPTKDCDIIHPALPPTILEAAREFATGAIGTSEALATDWLNNGPSQLTAILPGDWMQRLEPAFAGRAITLRSLGRADLLKTKLFALSDRAIDLQDCVALAPTADEIRDATVWLETQGGNPDWPTHVRATPADLERRLGHGL